MKPEVDRIMNELIQLRNEIALNAGFNNYSEYAFKQKTEITVLMIAISSMNL